MKNRMKIIGYITSILRLIVLIWNVDDTGQLSNALNIKISSKKTLNCHQYFNSNELKTQLRKVNDTSYWNMYCHIQNLRHNHNFNFLVHFAEPPSICDVCNGELTLQPVVKGM